MKKLCILTGTRAEYGILKPLIDLIQKDNEVELQLIVTGMHLSEQYGNTVDQIEKDGVSIAKKIDILLSSRTPVSVIKSIGIGAISFAEALDELKPDFLILLGDRFELLPASQAALILNIPVVHIHGGELTEGNIDDAIRHSVTKMSYLHFTSTEEHRQRVIQLGEAPARVFNVGAPGLDNILQIKLIDKVALANALDVELKEKVFLVTYHPVTLDAKKTEKEIQELLSVLKTYKDTTIIFTMPNSDPHSAGVAAAIENFVKENSNSHRFNSLGQLRYLSALKCFDAVIGNSSSGLIEAPFFKTPTVNIGNRQLGRTCGSTVINVPGDKTQIKNAIEKALSPEFKKVCEASAPLYGDGKSSEKILRILKSFDMKGFPIKRFHDLKVRE